MQEIRLAKTTKTSVGIICSGIHCLNGSGDEPCLGVL